MAVELQQGTQRTEMAPQRRGHLPATRSPEQAQQLQSSSLIQEKKPGRSRRARPPVFAIVCGVVSAFPLHGLSHDVRISQQGLLARSHGEKRKRKAA